MIALDHPLLFGVKSRGAGGLHHRIDASKQGGIGVNLVPVPRDLRRHDALDFQQGIVGVGAGKHMKDVIDPFEGASATFERGDRIGECRWCRVPGDRRDLRLMFRQRARIGREEVLGTNSGKRRDPAGGVPVLQ